MFLLACRSIAHPQQMNDYDCGVFTLMFASQLAFSFNLQFIQQNNMLEFRLFIVASILTQKQPGILLHSLGTSASVDPVGSCYLSEFDLASDAQEASTGYVQVALLLACILRFTPCMIKLWLLLPCLILLPTEWRMSF